MERAIVYRRLAFIADGPLVRPQNGNWRVVDAQTGEYIAGVCAVRISGGVGDLARITLEIHAHEADVHLNWGENSCSSPTSES